MDDEDDQARDPFREETGGPWHYSFRKGEMLFLALAELPDVVKVIIAMKDMPESDLKAMVLERLYVWHASKQPSGWLDVQDWLSPKDPDS